MSGGDDWLRSATDFITRSWGSLRGDATNGEDEHLQQPATGGMQPASWGPASSEGGGIGQAPTQSFQSFDSRGGSRVSLGTAGSHASVPGGKGGSFEANRLPSGHSTMESGWAGSGSLALRERIELLEAANTALMRQLHSGSWNVVDEKREEPRKELLGDCWEVTGWENASLQSTTVHADGHDVHVARNVGTGSDMTNVTLKGECKFVCAEDNVAMLMSVEMVTMAVLLLRCTKCQIVLGGTVPSVTLRDCINVEIIVGDAAVASGIETVGCYGIVITTVPQSAHSMLTIEQLLNSQQKSSLSVPERLTTTLISGNMYTTCSKGKSSANRALLSMAQAPKE